jgi:hypothetical protein
LGEKFLFVQNKIFVLLSLSPVPLPLHFDKYIIKKKLLSFIFCYSFFQNEVNSNFVIERRGKKKRNSACNPGLQMLFVMKNGEGKENLYRN